MRVLRVFWREIIGPLGTILCTAGIVYSATHGGINGDAPTPHWWIDAMGVLGIMGAVIALIVCIFVVAGRDDRRGEWRKSGPPRIVAHAEGLNIHVHREGGGMNLKLCTFDAEAEDAVLTYVAEKRAELRPNQEALRQARKLAAAVNAGN